MTQATQAPTLQFETPIYQDADHALRRAFGEVRPAYGNQWLGARLGRNLLSPDDQIRQDALVKTMCRENLSRREYALLVVQHGHNPGHPEELAAAIDDTCGYLLAWCDTAPVHAKSCVVRWSGRADLRAAIAAGGWPRTLRGWADVTGMTKSTLHNRAVEISEFLDLLYANTREEVKTLLRVRGLI